MSEIQNILGERNSTHGDFTLQASCEQGMKIVARNSCGWNGLKPYQKTAIEMVIHKLSRALTGDPDFRDHWIDIAGYATLVANRVARDAT